MESVKDTTRWLHWHHDAPTLVGECSNAVINQTIHHYHFNVCVSVYSRTNVCKYECVYMLMWICMCVCGVDCVWLFLIRELLSMNDSKMQTIFNIILFSPCSHHHLSSSTFPSFLLSSSQSISFSEWNEWLIDELTDLIDRLIDWVFYPREDVTRAWSQSKILQDGCIDIMMRQPLSMNAVMQ